MLMVGNSSWLRRVYETRPRMTMAEMTMSMKTGRATATLVRPTRSPPPRPSNHGGSSPNRAARAGAGRPGSAALAKIAGVDEGQGLRAIGSVARELGLTARAIRYYEEYGLLRPAVRVKGADRLYDQSDVGRLAEIKRLREAVGFSLAEI